MARIAFKPIRPGNYHGHFESYESEIAAYELDKLLGLGMTPPTVEKRIAGDVGAAVMWAAPTRSFTEFGGPPSAGGTDGQVELSAHPRQDVSQPDLQQGSQPQGTGWSTRPGT